MTKKEIVKTISEECGLTQLKTKEIVQKTFEAIIDTLVTEGRIELRNFGVFEVKKRAARRARNPRTGTSVDVPEKFVVTFKPGKEMEERVLLLQEESAAAAQAESQPVVSPTSHQAPEVMPSQPAPTSPPPPVSPSPTNLPPSTGSGSPAPPTPPPSETPQSPYPPFGGQP